MRRSQNSGSLHGQFDTLIMHLCCALQANRGARGSAVHVDWGGTRQGSDGGTAVEGVGSCITTSWTGLTQAVLC